MLKPHTVHVAYSTLNVLKKLLLADYPTRQAEDPLTLQNGLTALHLAAWKGHLVTVDLLLHTDFSDQHVDLEVQYASSLKGVHGNVTGLVSSSLSSADTVCQLLYLDQYIRNLVFQLAMCLVCRSMLLLLEF